MEVKDFMKWFDLDLSEEQLEDLLEEKENAAAR